MIKTILFDFDGVIMDSMPVRDYGFRKIFEHYPQELVDQLIIYHNENGGLSRFHKIKYFYNTLLGKEISEEKIQEYANSFSKIMKSELPNPKYLIEDSIKFIKNNANNYNLHIVSGSEGQELNYLCQQLDLEKSFITIEGSPTPKNDLIKNILNKYQYNPDKTILIGDSINDYQAAQVNNITFYGYNNLDLQGKDMYIRSFRDFVI